MIVRIADEGSVPAPDEVAGRLNELDNEAVAAVEAGDEPRFHELFDRDARARPRRDGNVLGDDELEGSDVIIPPPRDVSFAEAQAEFTGDGLIPD